MRHAVAALAALPAVWAGGQVPPPQVCAPNGCINEVLNSPSMCLPWETLVIATPSPSTSTSTVTTTVTMASTSTQVVGATIQATAVAMATINITDSITTLMTQTVAYTTTATTDSLLTFTSVVQEYVENGSPSTIYASSTTTTMPITVTPHTFATNVDLQPVTATPFTMVMRRQASGCGANSAAISSACSCNGLTASTFWEPTPIVTAMTTFTTTVYAASIVTETSTTTATSIETATTTNLVGPAATMNVTIPVTATTTIPVSTTLLTTTIEAVDIVTSVAATTTIVRPSIIVYPTQACTNFAVVALNDSLPATLVAHSGASVYMQISTTWGLNNLWELAGSWGQDNTANVWTTVYGGGSVVTYTPGSLLTPTTQQPAILGTTTNPNDPLLSCSINLNAAGPVFPFTCTGTVATTGTTTPASAHPQDTYSQFFFAEEYDASTNVYTYSLAIGVAGISAPSWGTTTTYTYYPINLGAYMAACQV